MEKYDIGIKSVHLLNDLRAVAFQISRRNFGLSSWVLCMHAFLLIPPLGTIGVIIGTLVAGLPSMFWGLYWIWKHYQVGPDLKSSVKILIASTTAALVTYILLIFLHVAEWIRLGIGGIIFLMAYIAVAPLIGAAVKSDIDNLRTMLSGLGIVSKIINLLFAPAEKIADYHTRENV